MPTIRHRSAILLAFATIAPLIAAGPATAPGDRGRLLIIGGGMTRAMAPVVYGVLADQLPAHGVVGYLPTAGEAMVDTTPAGNRLAAGLKGRTLTVLDVTDPAKADDPALARQIEACDALFFGGGAQSRVLRVFHPDGRPTLIAKAVDAVLARGGVVAGTSAGAEIMTDPMIDMGDSGKALADPASLPIGQGMGYFPFGMVDQHFLQRGRFGRLIVALERTHRDFGFGISEARAMLVDRATARLTTIGRDAVVFIDRRQANGRTGLRVSVLGDGDVVDGHTGAVTVSPHRSPRDLGPRAGAEPDLPDAWAKLALDKLFHDLVNGPHATADALDPHTRLRFAVDGQTKLYAAAADPQDTTILNLRLDVRPLERPPTTGPASRP